MTDKHGNFFDLPILLKSGDLDIRGMAENNSSLSVGEYFDALSKFIDRAPEVKDALARISNFDGDANAFQSLAHMKNLLAGIGCGKLMPFIDDILDAGEKGKVTFAAAHAQKILNEFNKFHALTTSAKINHESDAPSDRELSLQAVLQRLDQAARKPLILAVDDASVMLKTIIAALSDDYKVQGLTNPMLLEKVLQSLTPELFLLDYNMPGRSGLDLVPIIRSFEKHKDTPIIFVTSMRTFDHLSSAVALGACDFVVKPIQPDILREKVAKHIVSGKPL